jgi:EAL domain-containing protein (putative c-di-GMP-specific phosphodiesterase class I)
MPAPRSQEPTVKNEWYDRLQTALRQEAFQLAYQPIVNLHADPAEYFEVLVRMVGPDGALIPAGQFMPPAEESGQSVAIDHWVLQHAIRALAELHREKRKVTFFINLSRRVLDDPELLITTQQVLQETHVRGKHVVLEVDEAAMLTQADPASPFVRAVKQLGCVLCVDNFGRALTATTKLRELPVEYLKLDASLVQNLRDDPVARASLKAVIDVAKTLNKKVIAKGVESAEALSELWTLGVDYVQGHYFQQAETALDYEFADETTLSGEVHSPHWTAAQTKKR